MKLIALTGRAGVGKDTVGAILSAEHDFTRHAFASPIKAGLNAMFGWNMNAWEDREWKEAVNPTLEVSPRRLAQTLGTEWGRDTIDQEIWVKAAQLRWENYRKVQSFAEIPGAGLVITDLRFENEAAWVRAQGGTVVHVVRPSVTPVETHTSENGIIPALPDEFVINNGSIDDLYIEVSKLIRNIH